MKKLKKIFKKNKKIIIPALGIGILIMIGIFTIVILAKHNNTGASGTSLDIRENTSENASVSNQNEEITTVTGEVKDMEDEQDPLTQNRNDSIGNGAVINSSDLKKIENATSSNGIDVSKYQSKIDWVTVAASGIDFAMIRVGYRTDKTGVIMKDLYAEYNLQKAVEAGVKVGIYFFSTATSKEEVLEEAAWTCSMIAKYSITYPVVYNCEGFTESDSRMYGISNASRTDYAMAFLNYVKNEGYETMLYAAKSELENSEYWDTNRISSSHKIWIAQYPDVPYPQTAKPSYSGSYAMWQYTNKGIVGGISGNVDINVAYFKYDSVASPKDTSGVINADNPDLGIVFTETNDQVTAKEETNLRKTPNTNGEIVTTIKNGVFVTRIATGNTGWSKLNYNGQVVYAKTDLLTSEIIKVNVEAGINFTEINEQITAKELANVRTAPNDSTTSTIVGQIAKGQIFTRKGVGDNGWSRIDYNGQTCYVKTSLITTDIAVKVTEAAPVLNVVFTSVDDMVTSKENTNLRDLPTTDSVSKVIATLTKGVYIQRTGMSGTETSGWSRLIYEGQTVYASSSLLTK